LYQFDFSHLQKKMSSLVISQPDVVTSTNGNSDSSSNPDQYLTVWRELWSKRDTAWHLTTPHPTLQRYMHLLLDGRSADEPARVLFPLCGKNVDMLNMWSKGHTVYGVECANEAIQDFFSSAGLPYSSRSFSDTGNLHSAVDGRLNIVQHNFLTLNYEKINGSFDIAWDRGAFGTITEAEQRLYVQTVRRLMAPNFRYLLLVLEFDETQFTDLPYNQPESKIHKYFGEFAEITKLESRVPDHVGVYQRHMGSPLEVRETTYLLTAKSGAQAGA